MLNRLDASAFSQSLDFYITEFEGILTKIVFCYKMMINDKIKVLNNEENIRDLLYCKYLNNNNVRNRIGLNYNIACEPAEYKDNKCSGYVDLKIFSQNSLTDTTAYFIIECKRLDNQNLKGKTGLNAEYISNGIMRFVKEQYLTNKDLNGMIGFVVESLDISKNIQHINNLLKNEIVFANTLRKLTATDFIRNYNYQYYSEHRCEKSKKNIKLYHLMLDFSKNIKD